MINSNTLVEFIDKILITYSFELIFNRCGNKCEYDEFYHNNRYIFDIMQKYVNLGFIKCQGYEDALIISVEKFKFLLRKGTNCIYN